MHAHGTAIALACLRARGSNVGAFPLLSFSAADCASTIVIHRVSDVIWDAIQLEEVELYGTDGIQIPRNQLAFTLSSEEIPWYNQQMKLTAAHCNDGEWGAWTVRM